MKFATERNGPSVYSQLINKHANTIKNALSVMSGIYDMCGQEYMSYICGVFKHVTSILNVYSSV